MMNPNVLLHEQAKIVVGLAPVVPSSAAPQYVSMKGYPVLTIIVMGANGASGITGSAIALNQATAIAGTSAKALAFSTVYQNTNTGANDTLTSAAVTNNTFTVDNTASKNNYYEITVHEQDLDNANSFDCVQATAGNAVNQTISILYILWPAKYGKGTPPSAILD